MTLSYSTVSGNRTEGDNANGGGVMALGDVVLSNSTVSTNYTIGNRSYGGGIASSGNVMLSNSTLSNNSTQGYASDGGGLIAENVTLTSSTVSGNHTKGRGAGGGGVIARGSLLTPSNVTISQSTVSDNHTEGDLSWGGGVRTDTVTVTDSTVSGNYTQGDSSSGGGVFAFDSLTLDNSTVTGNYTIGSGAAGGGLNSRDVTLIDSTVSDNHTAGTGAVGGGVEGSHVVLTNSTVSRNHTKGLYADGGGIFSSIDVSLTYSTVDGNSTKNESSNGGGIMADEVTFSDSTASGNYTEGESSRGGGVYAENLTLYSTTISGNHTQGDSSSGGGVFARYRVTLNNSTVSNNYTEGSDANGGGVYTLGNFLTPGTITLSHSTITKNEARHSTSEGGGFWKAGSPFSDSIVISHSILTDNTAGGGKPDIEPGTGAFNVNYSLIGTKVSPDAGTSGNNVVTDAPLLGPLTNNGGPTKTHALLAGSPAIDAGDPGIVAPPGYDQRGAPYQRIADGDADGTARIDIGAFEVPTTFVVTTDVDEFDGVIDPNLGGAMSLREAITLANLAPQPINITFDTSLDGTTIMIDQADLGGLPTISDHLSIDVNNLPAGLTIHAGHGLDGVPRTADGLYVLRMEWLQVGDAINVQVNGLTLTGADLVAAILAFRVNLVVNDSLIIDNAAVNMGGGISITSGSLSLNDSIVENNEVGSSLAVGGGILASVDTMEIIRSSITGNSASSAASSAHAGGGGIYFVASRSAIFSDSIVSDNYLTGNDVLGAGIFGAGDDVKLIRTTVSGNTAVGSRFNRGGGLYTDGHWTIVSSTISGNSINGEGGGIFNRETYMTIHNSTITANYALEGDGSGISRGAAVISSSIISGNVNSDFDGSAAYISSDGYNLIGTGTAIGSFNQPGDQVGILDPLLGPLADNGGPTMTHALLPGSPALDAGNGSGSIDQRGMTTPVDLPGITNAPDGDGSDIGAYEAQINPSADFDSNLVVNGIDFLFWQRGFGLTTTATLPDGNSDDDGDTDHSDFAAWEVSFGESLPSPLAAHRAMQTESVLPLAIDAQLVAQVAALTAPDVLRLQETRPAESAGPHGNRVAYVQPGVRSGEIVDRALREFPSSNRVAQESMEFHVPRQISRKSAAAEEATIDQTFAEFAEDALAVGW